MSDETTPVEAESPGLNYRSRVVAGDLSTASPPVVRMWGRVAAFRAVLARRALPIRDDGRVLRWTDDYGYLMRDHEGIIVFSTANTTWSQVDTFLAPGGETTERQYDALRGREGMAIRTPVNPPPADRLRSLHGVDFLSNGRVRASGGEEDTLIVVLLR